MASSLEQYYAALSAAQKRAADFGDGALLLLAGPGSGKTRVLTARLGRLLQSSPGEKFRVLALTFTNAAASEMRERVEAISPEVGGRAFIGTFHSFCADLIRQHGTHVGVRPDFTVLTEEEERSRIFRRAMAARPELAERVSEWERRNVRVLPLIDRLKSKGIRAPDSKTQFQDQDLGDVVAECYELYDAGLGQANSLDFASILAKALELISDYPNIARLIRVTYKYWSVDEFQDTNEIQFRILSSLSDNKFRNLFVVADEDQIIYQWNGASYQRIEQLVSEFGPKVMQLPKNYRCPEAIVDLANNLIGHNSLRRSDKSPTESSRIDSESSLGEVIELYEYASDHEEAEGIADIASALLDADSSIAILARNRYILEMIQASLVDRNIPAKLIQRRTDFLSRTYSLGYRLIRLCVRRLDEDVLSDNVDSLAQLTELGLSVESVIATGESEKIDLYLALIREIARLGGDNDDDARAWVSVLTKLDEREIGPDKFMSELADLVGECTDDASTDFTEDREAWRILHRDIKGAIGAKPSLDRFLQELDMRSKEPPLRPDEIALMTIHSSKGMEFDVVFLAGLAEEVLPSWQSLKSGDTSPELEEERRNCFVAITRARKKLILTYANSYRGWKKAPSRFLAEMGFK